MEINSYMIILAFILMLILIGIKGKSIILKRKNNDMKKSLGKVLIYITKHRTGNRMLASGLCFALREMLNDRDITEQEYHKLLAYIHKHRPNKERPLSWEAHLTKPRIDWIIQQMLSL